MRVLILGASGHGRVVADAITSRNDHELVGFVDCTYSALDLILGYPLLGSDTDIARIVGEHSVDGIVVAVGDNWTRAAIIDRLTTILPHVHFPAILHASAVVGKQVSIAEGSVIMAGAILNPGVTIGRHAIVNTAACVDHDSEISAFASVAPRVTCGGAVFVGQHTAIGIGATAIHGVRIGEHVVIGAGAVVIDSIPAYTVALGVPARVLRARQAGERYL